MNKGLEMIEAAYLFAMPPERIDVLIHPQSIIHSLVEYADGSTLAQLGPPDMRTPIACAFAWPDRLRLAGAAAGSGRARAADLRGARPASASRPCDLAREALQAGRRGAGGDERRQRGRRRRLP